MIKEEVDDEDMDDDKDQELLSTTSGDTDYQKHLMEQSDFFVAHKSGSGHPFLTEEQQQQLQRQHLAGFLLTPTTSASNPSNNQSTNQNSSTSTSTGGNGSSVVGIGGANSCSNNSSHSHNNEQQHHKMKFPNNNNAQVYLLPCPLCEVPLEPRIFRQHLDRHYPRDSPVCPVIQCGRRFAHPNSVRNHMRLKHTTQWAKMKAMRSSGGPYGSGI